MKEIGSEFHWEEQQNGVGVRRPLIDADDWSYTFSGRTAYEVVINDVKKIKKVIFPSYCCSSMIEPFEKVYCKIEFYDINWKDGFEINFRIPEDCDVVVICNYFGYICNYPKSVLRDFQKRGGVVIEDITHSVFSMKSSIYEDSDYYVASLRKWGALISGGFCAKNKGKFLFKPDKKIDNEFIQTKKDAMMLKAKYLEEKNIEEKERYIKLFNTSNKWLEENYSNRMIDEWSMKKICSWDIENIRKRRIANAITLYRGLEKIQGISTLFSIDKMDCPLFVPIILEQQSRDEVRNMLIRNNVYCPIHWPKPNKKCVSNLYDREVSLVCDQRYKEEDMSMMVDLIRKG